MNLNPLRLNTVKTCELLCISRETLRQYMMKDPTFPKPCKSGASMQSKVYFDYQALIEWHQKQLET